MTLGKFKKGIGSKMKLVGLLGGLWVHTTAAIILLPVGVGSQKSSQGAEAEEAKFRQDKPVPDSARNLKMIIPISQLHT